MERAGRVLGSIGLSRRGVSDEQIAIAAWPVAVGKKIAGRTTAVRMVRDRLIVEVEDHVWQRQLFVLRDQILRGMEKATGRRLVEQLEFRVAVPKRPAARSEVRTAEVAAADDADGIRDPFLRDIYKAARRRATA